MIHQQFFKGQNAKDHRIYVQTTAAFTVELTILIKLSQKGSAEVQEQQQQNQYFLQVKSSDPAATQHSAT
jgi:hypothetical protein